jgi:hypothetical protein
MHADHHGGLYPLLEWRARRGCPPLLVIGPTALFGILLKYAAVVRRGPAGRAGGAWGRAGLAGCGWPSRGRGVRTMSIQAVRGGAAGRRG